MGKGKNFPSQSSKAKKHVISTPPVNTAKSKPIWRFGKLDRDGKFAFDLHRNDFRHHLILEKLIEYGNMTWTEIELQTHDKDNKTKHHFLKEHLLSKNAKERIRAKHLDEDSDSIFSFALQNKIRIIGIRDGAEFHIVWFDPEHEFCPTQR